MLVGVGQIIPGEYLKAKETATALMTRTNNRLGKIVQILANDIGRVNKDYHIRSRCFRRDAQPAPSPITKLIAYDANEDYLSIPRLSIFPIASTPARIVLDFSVGSIPKLVPVVGPFNVATSQGNIGRRFLQNKLPVTRGRDRDSFRSIAEHCLLRARIRWRRSARFRRVKPCDNHSGPKTPNQ